MYLDADVFLMRSFLPLRDLEYAEYWGDEARLNTAILSLKPNSHVARTMVDGIVGNRSVINDGMKPKARSLRIPDGIRTRCRSVQPRARHLGRGSCHLMFS